MKKWIRSVGVALALVAIPAIAAIVSVATTSAVWCANQNPCTVSGALMFFSNGATPPLAVAIDATHPLPTTTASGSVGNVTVVGPIGQQLQAASVGVVLPSDPDVRPIISTITVVDTGSTTTAGFNSVNLITGTPTAGSAVSQAINGQSSVTVTVTGTWTGTLTFEISADGGTTWVATTMRQRGASFATATTTGNGVFASDVSANTHFRARATAAVTGTASVKLDFAQTSGPMQVQNPVRVFDNSSNNQMTIGANGVDVELSRSITNPTSLLTPPGNTAAYTSSNNLIASSATANLIVVPSFAIGNTAGGAAIPRVKLFVNDAATGWGGTLIQVDLWNCAPTFTNGDHAAWALATGAACHVGTYTVLLTNGADGSWGEGAVSAGNAANVKLAAGTTVWWTPKLLSATTSTITSSHPITLTAELLN